MFVAGERGKSRGGTRNGRGNQKDSGAVAAGLAGFDDIPPNLDSEIQKCDGTEETTKNLLGALISKPKLTDKLLQKPPFRFLFDIVMQIIEVTGFARGLYSGEELDSANITEKEKKIIFLDKIIKVVGQALNSLVEAKPSKIVQGLDPQSTNTFLQLLAIAAKNVPNSTNVVRSVLEQMGESPPSFNTPEVSPQAQAQAQAQPKETSQVFTSKTESQSKAAPVISSEEKSRVSRDKESNDRVSRPVESSETEAAVESQTNETAERSMRPTTARRRPPKVKDGAKELTAKESAQSTGKRPDGILIDGQNDDDDEDMVVEQSRLADEFKAESKGSLNNDPQSKIVKDILSRQAELEAASKVN